MNDGQTPQVQALIKINPEWQALQDGPVRDIIIHQRPTPTVYHRRFQWWHYVAAVKTAHGRLFGIQRTTFMFPTMELTHCAISDVANKRHIKSYETRAATDLNVKFGSPNFYVDVDFLDAQQPTLYRSQTSHHTGWPRMKVSGVIKIDHEMFAVEGDGCLDREAFDRLLLPGETGWVWGVAWFDDGSTDMFYNVKTNYHEGLFRQRIRPQNGKIKWKPLFPQHWPAEFTPAYSEELCEVTAPDGREEVNGILVPKEKKGYGYLEMVSRADL